MSEVNASRVAGRQKGRARVALLLTAAAIVAVLLLMVRSEPGEGPAGSKSGLSAPSIRPEDFGALGNGQADDGPALQRAVDQADGRIIELTPGSVYRSDQALLLPSDTTIRGPRSAVLRFTWTRQADSPPGGGGPFYLGNADQQSGNVQISLLGFTIRGAGNGLPAGPRDRIAGDWPVPAVRLRAVDEFFVKELDVGFAPGVSILYQGSSRGVVKGNHVHHSGRDGILGTSLQRSVVDVVVRENLIERTGDDGIAVAGTTIRALSGKALPTDIRIEKNVVLGWREDPNGMMLGRGIALLAVDGAVVSRNRVESTASAGILVRGSPNPQSVDPTTGRPWRSSRIRIAQNVVRDIADPSRGTALEDESSRPPGAINVAGANLVAISQNDVAGGGIYVRDCRLCSHED